MGLAGLAMTTQAALTLTLTGWWRTAQASWQFSTVNGELGFEAVKRCASLKLNYLTCWVEFVIMETKQVPCWQTIMGK